MELLVACLCVLAAISSPKPDMPPEIKQAKWNDLDATEHNIEGPCPTIVQYRNYGQLKYTDFSCKNCGAPCRGSGTCVELVQTFDNGLKWIRGCVCVTKGTGRVEQAG